MPTIATRTPVIRNLRTLFREPLPDEPVILHLTGPQFDTLSADVPVSKRRIAKDALGMFVLPDPFGGHLAFLACAAGSGEGVACIPDIVRVRGAITFGSGCTCLRGKDPVERIPEADTCMLGFTPKGRLTCIGKCVSGGSCQLVQTQVAGRTFFSCVCS